MKLVTTLVLACLMSTVLILQDETQSGTGPIQTDPSPPEISPSSLPETHCPKSGNRTKRGFGSLSESQEEKARIAAEAQAQARLRAAANKLTDDTQVATCWSGLLLGNWSSCLANETPVLETLLNPDTLLTPAHLNERQLYRRGRFERNLQTYAPCINQTETSGDVMGALCKPYYVKLAVDCVFTSSQGPACTHMNDTAYYVASYYAATVEESLRAAHRSVRSNLGALEVVVRQCYHNHEKQEVAKCRGISWYRRRPQSRLQAWATQLYDDMSLRQMPRVKFDVSYGSDDDFEGAQKAQTFLFYF